MLDTYGNMVIALFSFANSEFGNGFLVGLLSTCVIILCVLMIGECIADSKRNKIKEEKERMKEVNANGKGKEKSHTNRHCA